MSDPQTTGIDEVRAYLRRKASESAWPPSSHESKTKAEITFEKLVASCQQLITDFEASNGECYCDNVQCAYHLAKEAVL